MAQLVELPNSGQVMTSRSVNSSPVSGSMLTAQSLDPASDSVSPSLSALTPLTLCFTLSLSKINIKKKKKKRKRILSKFLQVFIGSTCLKKMNQMWAVSSTPQRLSFFFFVNIFV